MPPSTLTLLGLVRHLAEVERTWFRRVIDGEDIPLIWSAEGDFQAAYDASGSTRAEARASTARSAPDPGPAARGCPGGDAVRPGGRVRR